MEKIAIATDDSPLTPLVPTSLVHTPPVPTPLEARIPPAWKGVDPPVTPLVRHPPSILQQLIEDSPPILRSPDAGRGKAPGRGEAPRALAFGESAQAGAAAAADPRVGPGAAADGAPRQQRARS